MPLSQALFCHSWHWAAPLDGWMLIWTLAVSHAQLPHNPTSSWQQKATLWVEAGGQQTVNEMQSGNCTCLVLSYCPAVNDAHGRRGARIISGSLIGSKQDHRGSFIMYEVQKEKPRQFKLLFTPPQRRLFLIYILFKGPYSFFIHQGVQVFIFHPGLQWNCLTWLPMKTQ